MIVDVMFFVFMATRYKYVILSSTDTDDAAIENKRDHVTPEKNV